MKMPTLKQSLKFIRTVLVFIFVCIALLGASVALIDIWMDKNAKGKVYETVNDVPKKPIALVLGTSKYIGKQLNPYYTFRIESAIELYHLGKVDGFLLSGDNAHRSYNEPWTMKRDLLKSGIPETSIFLDYAGFRTLDSIVRAKSIFALDEFVIVTQTFHCDRALFIARYYKINAACLGVPSPEASSWFNVRLREVFARTKAFLDLYIINTQPKFMGPEEPILESLYHDEIIIDVDQAVLIP